jgi:gentisate 1,2-dioxygenase
MGEHKTRARIEAILRGQLKDPEWHTGPDPRKRKIMQDLIAHAWDKVDRSLTDVSGLVDSEVLKSFLAMEIGTLVLGSACMHLMVAAMQELDGAIAHEGQHMIRNNVLNQVNNRLTRAINEGCFDYDVPPPKGDAG